MTDNIFTVIILLFLSYPLARLGSRFIDWLYAGSHAILSFPEEVAIRSRWRVPLLAISWAACGAYAAITGAGELPLSFLLSASFFLLLATVTDFEQQVIFDKMLVPFAAVGILAWPYQKVAFGDFLLAAFGGGLVFLLIAIVTRGAIGGGDIKLIAALGLWLGPDKLLSVVTYGLILGGLAAFLMLISKKKTAHSFFAYGPYFALSAIYFLLN